MEKERPDEMEVAEKKDEKREKKKKSQQIMTEELTLRQYLEKILGAESEFYTPIDRRSDIESDFVFRRDLGLVSVAVGVEDYYEERGFRLDLKEESKRGRTMRFVNGESRALIELRTDAKEYIYVSVNQRQLA